MKVLAALLLLLPVCAFGQNKPTETEKLEITRQISGEFIQTTTPLPAAEKHYKLTLPKAPKEGEVLILSSKKGIIPAGTKTQITLAQVEDNAIILDINGGGKEKHHIRDHIQVGIGGMGMGGVPYGGQQQKPVEGTTVVLDVPKGTGGLTGDDVKKLLLPYMRFSSRSATVDWVATLPPQFQAGIKGRYAVEGMTREMVESAIGKPDKKIREEAEGTETWIYGTPPGPTTFIVFQNTTVASIKKY